MGNWKTDRTTIFLGIVFLLFLVDLAYFLGIRNPDRFPHPFVIFRTLGDVEFLRGLPRMIRYMILYGVPGALMGVGIARLLLRSPSLTRTALRVLRLGQWLPFLIVFATPDAINLSLVAAVLCGCYHYLVAISILGLKAGDTRNYVARETTLQILLFYLLSQIWLRYWTWFEFAATYRPAIGVGVLITLIVLLLFINWIFRSNFELAAERCVTILDHRRGETWKSASGYLLFAFGFLTLWCLVGYLRFPGLFNSPLRVVKAGYHLLDQSEIYLDVGVSLLELLGGFVSGGTIAVLAFALVSNEGVMRKPVVLLLPLTIISPIVVWLLSWLVIGWVFPGSVLIVRWHNVIAVGFLIFFPFVQALWGLRDRPVLCRILLAIDNALPIAFVAMLFGELWAATAGLGFMMTVASATSQFDKRLAGFLIVVALLAGISTTLKWIAGSLYNSQNPARIRPAQVS